MLPTSSPDVFVHPPSTTPTVMLVRSSSLSGINQYQSDSDENHRNEESKNRRHEAVKERKGYNNGGAESGWGWLLSPARHNVRPHISDRSAFPPIRRSPILAQFLMKLQDNFTQFCRKLSDPFIENVMMACTVWEASEIDISSPPISSHSASAHNLTISSGNPTSEIMAWLSSRSGLHSSGIRPNSISRRSQTDSMSSFVDLENEWEKYVAPLLLLAGAEVLFSEMQHVRDKKLVRRMTWLFERVAGDLIVLKESVCDPFLLKSSPNVTASTIQTSAATNENVDGQHNAASDQQESSAAATVSVSLLALVAVAKVRCRMIQTQSNVFKHSDPEQESLAWIPMADTFEKLGALLPEPSDSALASPLIVAVRRELSAWTQLARLVSHVQRCKFAETLVCAKRLKKSLNLTSPAGFQVWFRTTLEDILSILPLVFDRIDAFAIPLYGFDKSRLMELAMIQKDRLKGSYDFETDLLELLRRHERAGGFSMAVAIVLDAESTSNLHVERGYVVKEEMSSRSSAPSDLDRIAWPAVFMRTTTHLGVALSGLGRSPSSSGVLGNVRRSGSIRGSNQLLLRAGSRQDIEVDSGKSALTNIGLMLSRASEPSMLVSSPKNKQRKTYGGPHPSPGYPQRTSSESCVSLPAFNVLEYEPDTGEPGWPYSEWPVLLSLLCQSRKDKNTEKSPKEAIRWTSHDEAFTYRSADRTTTAVGADVPEYVQDDASVAAVFGLPSLWSAATSSAGTVVGANSTSPTTLSRPAHASATCFHVVRLSEFMWLTVMVKESEEEQSRWTRRRTRGLSDDEILSFLNDIAPKLRLDTLFHEQTTARLLNRKQPPHLPTGFSLAHALEQATIHWDAQEFLRFLKESFGLRTQHHFGEGWRSPFGGRRNERCALGGRLLPKDDQSLLASFSDVINDEKAAANFFLGVELGRLLSETISINFKGWPPRAPQQAYEAAFDAFFSHLLSVSSVARLGGQVFLYQISFIRRRGFWIWLAARDKSVDLTSNRRRALHDHQILWLSPWRTSERCS